MLEDKVFALPNGFEHLTAHATWAIATEQGRNARRACADLDEMQKFYDDMRESLDDIFNVLDNLHLDQLDQGTRNLLLLVLSLAEITICIERFRGPGMQCDLLKESRMRIWTTGAEFIA